MDKHIVASIYELKGQKEKALMLYRQILIENPNDSRAEESLRRLASKNINLEYLNKDMYNFFIKATTKDELIEFERWLIGD